MVFFEYIIYCILPAKSTIFIIFLWVCAHCVHYFPELPCHLLSLHGLFQFLSNGLTPWPLSTLSQIGNLGSGTLPCCIVNWSHDYNSLLITLLDPHVPFMVKKGTYGMQYISFLSTFSNMEAIHWMDFWKLGFLPLLVHAQQTPNIRPAMLHFT